jgi:hypothetical protein
LDDLLVVGNVYLQVLHDSGFCNASMLYSEWVRVAEFFQKAMPTTAYPANVHYTFASTNVY